VRTLPNSFFEQKTLVAARELVGKYLVRKVGTKVRREMITEVEAYIGPHDLASHASKGRTARTEVMHAQAGTIYVYLIYGMYWMLNIVTEAKDYPAAILIRSTEHVRGPGRVTREFAIDKNLNGLRLGTKSGLWIEDGPRIPDSQITRTPRIGVDYAKEWASKPYRFLIR